MKGNALVLFHGDVFPYHVLDKAIAWAQQEGASLQVLFLEERPVKEGYVFPSDIDAAETLADTGDVEAINEKILQRKIKRVKDNTAEAGVACSIAISKDVSADTVLAAAADATVIFSDGDQVDEASGKAFPFSLKGFPDETPVPVQLIKAE